MIHQKWEILKFCCMLADNICVCVSVYTLVPCHPTPNKYTVCMRAVYGLVKKKKKINKKPDHTD